jgi:hypothetical protein
VSKPTRSYPSLKVDTAGVRVVSNAGAVLLVQTATTLGLDRALSMALARWRRPTAVHDPGKIVCDLALTLAIGGTAWPILPSCAPSLRCSGWWLRIRPCHD